MKNYKIFVDGYMVGIEEFTPQEVKTLEADQGIKLIEVEEV